MAATDDVTISNNLQLVYQKDHIDNFANTDGDAFWADVQETAADDNMGAGFVVQVRSRGGINVNPSYILSGTGTANRSMFTIPPVSVYWRASWTLSAWLRAGTKSIKGQFDLAKEEIDDRQRFLKFDLGKMMQGRGWGSLAGIQAVAGSTITIGAPDGTSATVVKELMNRFYPGQILRSADLEHTGAMRGADPGDSATVLSTNPSTGIITTVAAVPGTWAVGDYLSEYGFRYYDNTASGRRTLYGLEAWLDPVAAISGDSIGGTTRFNRSDLQPLRFDASTIPLSTLAEQLINADEFAVTNHLHTDGLALYVSPKAFRELTVDVQNTQLVNMNVEKTRPDGTTFVIGQRAFMLACQSGPVPVLSSKFVRPGLAFWGPFKNKKEGFRLLYAGDKIVNINNSDGMVFRVAQDGVTNSLGVIEPGFKAEGYFQGNLTCEHPGNYMVITNLASTAV